MGKWLFSACALLMTGSAAWIFLAPVPPGGVGEETLYTQVEELENLDFQEKLKSLQFPVDVETVVQKRPHQYRLILGAFSSPMHADERRFEVLTAGVNVGIEESGDYWRVVTDWYDTPTQVDQVVSQLLQQNLESEMETRILAEVKPQAF